MMTVLAKSGLSDKAAQELKGRGLYVPRMQEPFPQVMKSPSEDWVIYALDEFTPPLTKEERVRYIEHPEAFCHDLLENLELFSEVCATLFGILPNIRHLPDEEAVAGFLAVIRIFQAAMDYHYYKYDRHLEFYEYETSPVGFHWNRLLHLCQEVAQRARIANPQLWSREQALSILSQVGRGNMAVQFLLSCSKILIGLKEVIPESSQRTPDEVLRTVEQQDRELYGQLLVEAQKFRQVPTDFVRHCLRLDASKALDRLSSLDILTRKLDIKDVTDHLRAEEIKDFEHSVKAMELFQAVQEEETYRFYGLMPRHNAQNLEVGFSSWGQMTAILEKYPELIKAEHREATFAILHGNPIVGTRRLLSEGERYFNEAIQQEYFGEMGRWIASK